MYSTKSSNQRLLIAQLYLTERGMDITCPSFPGYNPKPDLTLQAATMEANLSFQFMQMTLSMTDSNNRLRPRSNENF